MRRIVLILGLLWGYVCNGQDTLFVSTKLVVHLRFASELKYVNLGSRDLVARIVNGSKDFVAVKARAAFEGCTSLTCLEATGKMHAFLVAYREHPERLEVDMTVAAKASSPFEDIMGMKQELYHIGVREYGIQVLCENIFVKDDRLFLLVSVRNDSAVGYKLSAPRFAVESARRPRRGLQYVKAVQPKQIYGLGTVAPGEVSKLVFTFDKLTLLKGQVFRAYFYEDGGSRNLVMTLPGRDVNGAGAL